MGLIMYQDSELIKMDDVLFMLPTLSYDSIEKFIEVFQATYHDMEMMKASDRELELEFKIKRLAIDFGPISNVNSY